MAACGLQPGRKGSGAGRTSMGDARYSRSSTTMGMYNNKGKRMCLYICSMYCNPRISPYIYGGLHSYFQGRQSTTTQATQMTNASSFDFEPYGIDANARTMAEFAAAMMRAIAEISVDNYGLSLHSLSSGASKTRYLKIC